MVERSKRASNSLSGLIGEIQAQIDRIVSLMPKDDPVESGTIVIDQIINSIFERLNENAAKCVTELDQMRQVAETIFTISSETFEEINLKLDSTPVETGRLTEIQKVIDEYLESVAYTGTLKDKLQGTINNLQSATDLLINRNV